MKTKIIKVMFVTFAISAVMDLAGTQLILENEWGEEVNPLFLFFGIDEHPERIPIHLFVLLGITVSVYYVYMRKGHPSFFYLFAVILGVGILLRVGILVRALISMAGER